MILRLDPNAYYDDFQARILGLDGEAMEAARDSKELRYKDVGGVPTYKGAWLIEWLDRSEHESGGRREVAAR